MRNKTFSIFTIALLSVVTILLFQNCSSETPFKLTELQNEKIDAGLVSNDDQVQDVVILEDHEIPEVMTPAPTQIVPSVQQASNSTTNVPATTSNMNNTSQSDDPIVTPPSIPSSPTNPTINDQSTQKCALNVERVLLSGNGQANETIASIDQKQIHIQQDADGKHFAAFKLVVHEAPKHCKNLHLQLQNQNGQLNIKLDEELSEGEHEIRLDNIQLLEGCAVLKELKGRRNQHQHQHQSGSGHDEDNDDDKHSHENDHKGHNNQNED